jgi:hypothetical protein
VALGSCCCSCSGPSPPSPPFQVTASADCSSPWSSKACSAGPLASCSAPPRRAATFFPLIGVSAFLGAGYRVPLAGVVFAAEASGRPGSIVPGLIAAIVAQLFMGRASASPYQVAARAGHLERRFALPLTAALRTDVATTPPDTRP